MCSDLLSPPCAFSRSVTVAVTPGRENPSPEEWSRVAIDGVCPGGGGAADSDGFEELDAHGGLVGVQPGCARETFGWVDLGSA